MFTFKKAQNPGKTAGDDRPKRAAVSAFGFGGINAHLLVESFVPEPPQVSGAGRSCDKGFHHPLCHCGHGDDFRCPVTPWPIFQDLLGGQKTLASGPGHPRWRRADHLPPELLNAHTLFMEDLGIDLKNFNIPPNQLSRILPQHLVMLNAARTAP